MSFNWSKVLPAFIAGVNIANKIGAGKTGKERLGIALDSVAEILDTIELGADQDLFNDPALLALKENVLTAIYELQKALQNAKQAKGTGGPPQ